MSEYNFNYLLDVTDSEGEEQEEDITQYLAVNSDSHTITRCSFCSAPGHTFSHCIQVKSLGQKLHLKGIEVRKFDVEMDCQGNSIKAWVENLTYTQINVLSNRINLRAYANTLWDRGMIESNNAMLNTRQDYNICLRFFYYFEPTGNYLKKKLDFVVGVGACDDNSITTFECPICIDSSVPIKEMIRLGCSHCICKDCFCNYLNHMSSNNGNKSLKTLKKPSCSLCRSVISKADFNGVDYLNDINKKYIFLK